MPRQPVCQLALFLFVASFSLFAQSQNTSLNGRRGEPVHTGQRRGKQCENTDEKGRMSPKETVLASHLFDKDVFNCGK